jgi:hypothetical protein
MRMIDPLQGRSREAIRTSTQLDLQTVGDTVLSGRIATQAVHHCDTS